MPNSNNHNNGSTREKRLRKLLLEKKRKMWSDLREDIFQKLGREYNTQFDNPHDLEELSLIDLIEDTGLAVADIHKQELERMDEALRMLDNGSYGVCTVCGEDIEEDRLKAVPFALMHARCKEGTEGKEKKPTL